MITFKHKGSFKNTEEFMNRSLKREYKKILNEYGKMGVELLASQTPVDTGVTASSWNYGIEEEKGKVTLFWTNSNENQGAVIVLLLIYGYGLQNGSYVQGTDFVSPAMRPFFKAIADKSWKEVTR